MTNKVLDGWPNPKTTDRCDLLASADGEPPSPVPCRTLRISNTLSGILPGISAIWIRNPSLPPWAFACCIVCDPLSGVPNNSFVRFQPIPRNPFGGMGVWVSRASVIIHFR